MYDGSKWFVFFGEILVGKGVEFLNALDVPPLEMIQEVICEKLFFCEKMSEGLFARPIFVIQEVVCTQEFACFFGKSCPISPF